MSKLTPTSRLAAVAGLTLASLVWGSSAHALTITIGLQEAGTNSGNITNVASADGQVSYSGGYGSFSLDLVSGTGIPVLNPALQNFVLNSTSLNMEGTANGLKTLTVYITEQGLTGNLGALYDFTSGFTQILAPTGTGRSVTLQTWIGATNGLFEQSTLLGTATNPGTNTVATTDPGVTVVGTYSVTEVYVVTLGKSQKSNATITLATTCNPCGNTNNTPLPAGLPLLGSVLGGGLLLDRVRRYRLKAKKPTVV